MVIVLDKICLIGVIAISLHVGYKLGREAEKLERSIQDAKEE